MNYEDIKSQYQTLNKELKKALATMEYSNKVLLIRDEIKELQDVCPHNNGSFDFSTTDNCPYCGKNFRK